jgi:hypothetical protein
VLRLVAGRIVEASRVIWRRGVILWEPLLPDERSFTSSSSRVDDVVFSGKVADGVKEVPTTSLQRVVLLGIRVLCCGLFGQKSGRWWVSRKRCQLIDYIRYLHFILGTSLIRIMKQGQTDIQSPYIRALCLSR